MPKSKAVVSDSESSGADEESAAAAAPKGKKPKTEKEEKTKKTAATAGDKFDSEGRLELMSNKFVSVREFKGRVFVDIREFYEKDGKMLPGKKGVSLGREQWVKLRDNVDAIDQKLNEMIG